MSSRAYIFTKRYTPVTLISVALFSLSACVEERVIYDNSIDAKLNRSMKPGYVTKGGQDVGDPKFKADGESHFLGIHDDSQWKSTFRMDPAPNPKP